MLTLALSLLLAGQSVTPPTHATLVAGTVSSNGTTLVRLRWAMDDGWIPDGGFNLYRAVGSAAPVKLNSSPLKVDPSGTASPTIQSAMTKIAVNGQQRYLNSMALPKASSATVFAGIRTSAATGLALQVGEKGIRSAIVGNAVFQAFTSKLPKPIAKTTTLTQVQQVGLARSQVIVGAMTVKGFAEKAGLGMDDTQVQAGAQVTYTLKAINAGVESAALATLPFKVGGDVQPPDPLVEVPIQTSAHTMDLHFEIPTTVDESTYGALWFQVTRFDTANPNGVSVSSTLIMPSYIATTDGNDTAALTSFVDPTTLKIHDLDVLSQAFKSLVTTTCVAKGLTAQKAQSTLSAIEQTLASAVIAKFPALAAPVKAFVLRKVVDPSPALDTYCVYRVTPIMTRNNVMGDPGLTSVVGVPAAQAPAPPATIAFTDAVAPIDVSTIKTSKTNAVRMQPTSGNFPPNVARPTDNPLPIGQTMLTAYRAIRKMDNTKMSLYPTVVPANYGRMVTLSWTPPAYTSPVRYRVYRGSGTGFTAGAVGTGAVAPPPFNGTNLPGHGVISGFPKSKYSLNTPPSTKLYTLLGATKPGETTFVDIVQRSYSATYYYYVLPVSRWGVDGAASQPVPVQVKESLPPTPPVVQSVLPTSPTTITATVQPNLQVEDVVTYQLMRVPITPTATVTTTEANGTKGIATIKNAKILTGALTKFGPATGVTMTLGGIPLASGAVGNGAAKFGIISHSSAGIALTAYHVAYQAAVLAKKAPPTVPADLAPVFVLSNYKLVASATTVPTATAPISLVDSTAVPGEEYVYCVIAVGAAGLSSDPGGFIDATISRPTADVPVISGAQFNLAADTVTFNITPPATGAAVFIVEREVVANDPTSWVQVGTVAAPASGAAVFTDGKVRPGGNVYAYRVYSVDSRGRSSITADANGNAIGYATITVTSS